MPTWETIKLKSVKHCLINLLPTGITITNDPHNQPQLEPFRKFVPSSGELKIRRYQSARSLKFEGVSSKNDPNRFSVAISTARYSGELDKRSPGFVKLEEILQMILNGNDEERAENRQGIMTLRHVLVDWEVAPCLLEELKERGFIGKLFVYTPLYNKPREDEMMFQGGSDFRFEYEKSTIAVLQYYPGKYENDLPCKMEWGWWNGDLSKATIMQLVWQKGN